MKKEYKVQFYKNPNTLLVCMIIGSLLLVAILIYIGKKYESDLIGIWLPILVLALPIIISKRFKRNFTKDSILKYSDLNFKILFYTLKYDVLIEEKNFPWEEIEAYRFYFSPKLTTSLTLYLKNKKSPTFIFLDNKTYEQSIQEESVFSSFYDAMKEYNRGVPTENKIQPRGGFIVTKTAGLIIWIEVAVIILAFILHLIYHSLNHSYYLILAIGFLLPQIVSRAQNRKMYEKISGLDSLG
ncbi:MAG: hypothetical protein H7334_05760 [Ferruginibacter sp.]|nr:hypothetical protein [Ferruginibacter sp.]